MHEYRDSRIARLMLKVDKNAKDTDLFVATTMLEMAGIEPGGMGRSLVLGVGQSPLACGLGSRDFGHMVVGICFHAANVHQQNFFRNRLRSRATFTHSTTKDLLLAMPVFTWDFVIAQHVNWHEISDFVLERMKDSKIVVAQKMPFDVGDFEREFFRVTERGYCHPAVEEDGEWVVFRVK